MIPASLQWWRATPAGAAWLERLPRLARECAAQWDLELGDAFADAYASLVLRVRRDGGAPAVLKIAYPDEETRHQAEALAHWGPDVAATVLAHDPGRRAMLLEHVAPGGTLPAAEIERTIPRMLARLWAAPPPGPPFRELADDAARWRVDIPRAWEAGCRPFPAALLHEALEAIEQLVPTQPDRVLCHQDLHGGNVLRSARAGHLVIDPLPVAGERAFDLLGVGLNHPDRALLGRVARAAGVDPERARRWALVHALAWGYEGPADDGGWLPRHIAVAQTLSAGR